MTRINSAIPVENLTDEHLLAEHREIKRLPYCLQKAIKSGSVKKIPERFVLGKGHVSFFLDKMYFTFCRYQEIRKECLRRGFKVENYAANWLEVPYPYMLNYFPTDAERVLLTQRIAERIAQSKKKIWHYGGNLMSKGDAIRLLTREGEHPDAQRMIGIKGLGHAACAGALSL